MAETIVITSGKGGVGKTSLTANLGIALSVLGKRVCLIDLDFGLNNLDVIMGVENKIVFDFADVVNGRCRVKQALIGDVLHKNLFVLPSNKFSVSSGISGANIKLVIQEIKETFDYILLDCPAGIDFGFHRAVAAADRAIIVTTPNVTSLRDANKVITILKSYRISAGLVINRARGDLMIDGKMFFPSDIEEMLKTKLIGVIPDEDEVLLSCGYGLPKNSDSFKAYKMLAKNVINGNSQIFNCIDKYTGIIGSIRKKLKKSL